MRDLLGGLVETTEELGQFVHVGGFQIGVAKDGTGVEEFRQILSYSFSVLHFHKGLQVGLQKLRMQDILSC